MLASEDRRLAIEFKLVAKTYKVFVGNDRGLKQCLAPATSSRTPS
jgi:hypothetical protein